MGERTVKNLRYPFYFFLFALLIFPVACTTTESIGERRQASIEEEEEPQDNAALRREDHDTAFHNAQSLPDATQRQHTEYDAVSGATTDAISGATMSQSVEIPATPLQLARDNASGAKQYSNTSGKQDVDFGIQTIESSKIALETAHIDADMVGIADGVELSAAVLVPGKRFLSGDGEAVQKTTVDQEVTAIPIAIADKKMDGIVEASDMSQMAVVDHTIDGRQGPLVNSAHSAKEGASFAELPEAQNIGKDIEPTRFPAAETDRKQEADTRDSHSTARKYEDTLADIISDFEEQGSTHGYKAPPTFHEEMLDLFSPQIFTVALSKEPETEQKVKVSRMVAVEEKQRLELSYPGHGWVYIGEQTAQQGLKYEQRKLQDNNSIFMFTAEKKGDYVLHFSYFDVFTNDFITDAVAVSVSEARSTAAKSMVRAPDYKNDGEREEPEQQMNAQAAASSTDSQPSADTVQQKKTEAISDVDITASSAAMAEGSDTIAMFGETGLIESAAAVGTEEQLTPAELLEKARTAIGAADAASAIQYLDQFFTASTQNLDEGWFLQGRAYELNGSARNIRRALAAYKTLTNTYPQSKYWAEADARIRYITSFYINIQ